jgi:hypothetical protein
MLNIQNMLNMENMENIQDTHIYQISTACISRLSNAMDTVSEVANAKVLQRDRENLETRCFKPSCL